MTSPHPPRPCSQSRNMNRSQDFAAYILVDRNGKVPVRSGDIAVCWTKTAAKARVESEKDSGHQYFIERIKIVRSGKRSRSALEARHG